MNLIFETGLFCKPLGVQLKGHIEKDKAKAFDEDSGCISRLRIRGLLSDSEAMKARKKLHRKVERAVQSFKGGAA